MMRIKMSSVAAGLLSLCYLMGLLLAGTEAFGVGGAPESRLIQELVRAQPHLVHDIAPPQIHHTSRSRADTETTTTASSVNRTVARSRSQDMAGSSMDDNQDVSDEMERMVHLDRLQEPEGRQGPPGGSDPETTFAGGPGASDTSLEASGGLYDTERDRGEEEGEERERRRGGGRRGGGEERWVSRGAEGEERKRRGGQDEEEEEEGERGEEEVGGGEESLWDQVEDLNHTAPGLDALIGCSTAPLEGYSASLVQESVPLAPPQHSGVSPPPPTPDQEVHAGLQELRAPLLAQVAPLDRELWEAEGEEEAGASGYGVFHSSDPTAPPSADSNGTAPISGGDSDPSAPPSGGSNTTAPLSGGSYPTAPSAPITTRPYTGPGAAVGTSVPDSNTGTDFGLVGGPGQQNSEKEEEEELEREEEEHMGAGLFTHNPTVPEVGMAPSRLPLQPSMEEEDWSEQQGAELDGVRVAEKEAEQRWREMEREAGSRRRLLLPLTTDFAPTVGFTNLSWDWLEQTTPTQVEGSEVRGGRVTQEIQQVVCIDWRELAGRGYVILNMTDNMDCDEFRAQRGVRLLEMLERIFARRMNSPEGSWVIYLSKPTHHQHQILMNVASEHGVIPTKDVLSMLGEIRRNLNEVGIQNYSAASHCQAHQSHSQNRSDYGKLFVVLVIIGSICMVIITAGLIYICWTRRAAASKTMTRAEELHFVENGCHDNPTLDVATDSQSEMQEKKATNGLAGGGERGGEEGSHWKVFVNQPSEAEEEEQDTHL